MTAISSVAVANEFIGLGKQDNKHFTPMQLLKLTYIAHGWHWLTNSQIDNLKNILLAVFASSAINNWTQKIK